MKSAGCVDDDDVLAATDARVYRIESDGCWVGACASPNEVGAGTLCPRAKLVDRSSAKSVGRTDQNRHLIRLQEVGELPYEGGLAGPVHTNDENDCGSCRGSNYPGIAITGTERVLDGIGERVKELVLSFDEAATRLRFDFGYQAHCRRNAEVGFEKNFFEPLQRSLNGAGASDRRDISECDVFYSGPQRAGGYVARAPKYS